MLIEHTQSQFSISMYVSLCKFKDYGGEIQVDHSVSIVQIILIRRK